MTDDTEEITDVKQRPSRLPIILCAVALLIGGGIGFYLVFTQVLFSNEETVEKSELPEDKEHIDNIVFVPIEKLVVTLGNPRDDRHLQFSAQLEVPSIYQDDVRTLMPRVIDVLNGYLRALEVSDVENVSVLSRLRSQMLYRAKIVLGDERVNDLLIMEFLVN